MRALVVDDSKPSRSILARVLRDLRFECTEATNGLEALAALSTSPRPDLVTINWHMPVMDGIELLKRLRAAPAHRDLKLLMVSTENDRDRITAALAAGADDYLAKPFTASELRNVLERAALISDSGMIQHTGLDIEPSARSVYGSGVNLSGMTLEQAEKIHIQQVLDIESGNVVQAATRLGIPRSSLYAKIRLYNLRKSRED